MKIAIITFHAADNCGSQLQAFALFKILKDRFNQDPVIIDYSNKNQIELYSTFRKVRTPKDLLINLYRSLFFFLMKKYKASFSDFIKKYFILTDRRYSNNEELKELDGKYDIFITGSDQVWNTKAYDFDDSYFLDFVTKGRKIAYAPSLGATNIVENNDDRIKYGNLLNDFYLLSVREENAKKILQTITNKNISVLLDPTLLLANDIWLNMAGERIIKEKYIFYYAFSYGNDANRIVMSLSKKYRLPVYIVDASAWAIRRKFMNGFKLSSKFGPLAFLNLIKYAEVVLTTSFHGTALSVSMHKKFWYLDTSMHNPLDDRATSLLKQLGLMNRMQGYDYLMKTDLFKDMQVDESKIDSLREKSFNYIQNSLKCC